jgi:hypothetical protein
MRLRRLAEMGGSEPAPPVEENPGEGPTTQPTPVPETN